jgi:hypothetical protein
MRENARDGAAGQRLLLANATDEMNGQPPAWWSILQAGVPHFAMRWK